MTIEENLGLAYSRGKRTTLSRAIKKGDRSFFIEKLKELMKMLEDSSLFRQLANHEGDVAIEIGGDNELIQVNNVAVVSSKFKLNEDEEGELMIVGPTRMQYSRVVALMEYMSKVIEDLYRSENR